MTTTQDRTNRANVFSAQNLSEVMILSLGDVKVRDAWDAVALLSHVSMIVAGFRLVGLGEDRTIENTSDGDKPQPLPSEWNSTDQSNYAFRYAHEQSSMHYMIKIGRLGSKAIVNGIAIEDEKVYTVHVAIKEFVSPASLPFTPSSSQEVSESSRQLREVFISDARVTDLATLFKTSIFQPLAPSLQKEGYEESAHTANPTLREPTRHIDRRTEREDDRGQPPPQDPLPPFAQPRPLDDPLAAPPRRPHPDFPPPGFEDEHEIGRRPGGLGDPLRRPLNIGERDLYPPGLGPNDPLRMGPHGGIGGGGGMHPTFDDPIFGGGQGGGGYNPRAPPGARYDPVDPGDGLHGPRGPRGGPQGQGGPRFPGGGGMGGAPPNAFGGFDRGDFL